MCFHLTLIKLEFEVKKGTCCSACIGCNIDSFQVLPTLRPHRSRHSQAGAGVAVPSQR